MLLYQEDIIDCLEQAITIKLGYATRYNTIYDYMDNCNLGEELRLTMVDYDMYFNPAEEF
jgi:hypothetical protein